MSPKPMIGQHDDRTFYHRRRWRRSELSETTSASRTVSNMPTPFLQITMHPSCVSFRHGGLNAAGAPLKIRIKLIEPSAK
jgi:hypothetical protein